VTEWHELGGKIGKNTEEKNHRAHYLEKLNDAKCPFLLVFLLKGHLQKKGKVGVLLVLRPWGMLELRAEKRCFVN